jgi:ankyrin repeat protein
VEAFRTDYDRIRKRLIDKGADVNAVHKVMYAGDSEHSALTFAVAREDIESVKYLLNKGANVVKPSLERCWLGEAARNRNVQLLTLLLKKGADPNACSGHNGCEQLPLHIVIKNIADDSKWIEEEKRIGREALRKQFEISQIPLSPELIHMYFDIDNMMVRRLLLSGASPNAQDQCGLSPMTTAVNLGANGILILNLLIVNGGDVNLKNKNGVTPLMIATDKSVVQLLIQKGADWNAKDKDGDNVLSAAVRSGKIDIIQLLIDKGADKNSKNVYGQTLLMYAAIYRHADVVKYLIERGADVNAKTVGGRTALTFAKEYKSPEIEEMLKRAGAKTTLADYRLLLGIQD